MIRRHRAGEFRQRRRKLWGLRDTRRKPSNSLQLWTLYPWEIGFPKSTPVLAMKA